MSKDFDLNDYGQRLQVAEIVESLRDTPLSALAVPILRNDDWEDIAKIGKNHFHFEYNAVFEGIYHFVRSKNKWVCFCAFYYLSVMRIDEKPVRQQHALLMSLKADSNKYLSNIAAHFLDNDSGREEYMIEPFELLERVMSLKKAVLFKRVSAEKLMGLAENFQSRAYKSGTLISREGEVSDHLYIIRKGSLKIIKGKNNTKTVLSVLHAGETYGEIGLFNQAPRSASAIANDDCELWVIQRSALKKYLLDMPEIAYNFLEVFSEKLRKCSEEVAEMNASISKTRRDYLQSDYPNN
jgi:CRP-like cAMP-binding protein